MLVGLLLWAVACTPSAAPPVDAPPLEGSSEALAEAPGDPAEADDEVDEVPEPFEEPEPVPQTAYTIQPGDSLWAIARRHDCTIQALRDANGFADDLIVAGRTMMIPDCSRLAPPERPAPEPTAGGRTYRIQPGDYLERIATEVGCSVSQLMDANGLQNDVIFAGNVLQVPDCSLPVTEPPGGDAFVDGRMPEDDPPTDAPPTDDPTRPDAPPGGEATAVAAAGDRVHVVRAGDYLGRIASEYGCTVGELLRANELTSDRIGVGQRLRVPPCTGEGGLYEGLAALDPDGATEPGGPRRGGRSVRDNETLERLMRARGFRPPSGFKAYVLEIRFSADRSRVEQERHFSWGRSAYESSGWNAASTVKLYAAIAAFREIRRLGFTGNARLTFHGARRDHSFTLNDLVREAIVDSNNLSYNYLVTFVGFDRIHTDFFHERFGFRSAGLRRAYEGSNWMNLGWSSSFASSPRITVTEGSRTREIAARSGRVSTNCHGAACSTLHELGTTLRRVMLQEQLPARETFELHPDDLRTLRLALRAPRTRGEEVVQALGRALRNDEARFYHKAGFAGDWYSDNVYVFNPRSSRAWVVSLAGHPGRNALNDAARVIGELIASGDLAGT